MAIQMRDDKQNFLDAVLTMLCKVVLTFQSVDEISKCVLFTFFVTSTRWI